MQLSEIDSGNCREGGNDRAEDAYDAKEGCHRTNISKLLVTTRGMTRAACLPKPVFSGNDAK